MAEKQRIDWSTLWKKDDWVSVWIGFLILIIFMAGFTIKLPGWVWMTDRAFTAEIVDWSIKVESLAKDAEAKGEVALQESAVALKSALYAKDRKAIGDAAGKLEKVAKEAKDEDLKKKGEKLGKDIKRDAGRTIERVLSVDNLTSVLYIFIGFYVLALLGMLIMGAPIKNFMLGFPIVFVLASVSFFIAGNSTMRYWGLEFVLWALFIGLFISNVIGVPEWLRTAVKTEYFIKIGLVLLGAEVLFGVIMQVGAYGMVQALLVILVVFYFCLWLARKLRLDDEFSSILAAGVAVCGVSAAIAAGGAVRGDPKKVSHTVSLVLLCAVPMLVFMPLIAKWVGMPPMVAGAWIGGTIDTTGAVVAAGAIVGSEAMTVAAIIKMVQNVLIGGLAFLLAVWFVLKGKEAGERPGIMEIWFRFPKFVVGFMIASIVFSFFMAEADAKDVTKITGPLRSWWFCLAFLSIGLETKFKELVAMGGGRPAVAFVSAQMVNILWTLVLAYIIFGGIFWAAPTF